MSQLVPVQEKMKTMRAVLESRIGEIQRALPRPTSPERFVRVVLTNFQLTPSLLDCTPTSVYTAVLQAAQWGLELDPVLGQCYLVPYKSTCQLIIGYKGYLELARRHPDMSQVVTRVVREGDEFSVEYGLDEKLVHKPNLESDGVAPLVGAYCIWRLKNGEKSFVYMSRAEIDQIRFRSRASDKGPWTTDYDQMAMKTVIRRAAKSWPAMTELQKIIAIDERADAGIEQHIGETIDIPPALPPAGGATSEDVSEGMKEGAAALVRDAIEQDAALDAIEKLKARMHEPPEPSTGPYVDGIDSRKNDRQALRVPPEVGKTAEELARENTRSAQKARHEPRNPA